MNKNLIMKTISGVAALAILGATSLVASASPAEAGSASTLTIGSGEGYAGDKVTIEISVDNNPGFEGFGAMISYDEALTLGSKAVAGDIASMAALTPVAGEARFAISAAAAPSVSDDGSIVVLTFTIPEDAEPGTEYAIEWENLDSFADGSDEYADDMDLIDGIITVLGETPDETTTPAPAVTTPAATTTAAAVTEAPKTGSTGIAATAAVLLAAACSAVVIKKKRD